MSASAFSSPRERSWLHRPIHYERVPLRSSKTKIRLELALMVLALTVFAFNVI
jgi:hypothetical protein